MLHFPEFFIAIDSYSLEFPEGADRPSAISMKACVGVEEVPFPEASLQIQSAA